MPSISSLNASLNQQLALSRSQSSLLSAATSLSTTNGASRLSLAKAAQQIDTSALRSSAQAEAQKTAYKTEVSGFLLETVTDTVSRMTELVIAARGSSSASQKSQINEELSMLKESLSATIKSASVDGENWLFESAGISGPQTIITSAGTDANGALSVNTIEFGTLGTVLASDSNAERGVLTKSYSGTTAAGEAYSYHLLRSADTSSSSSQISVSGATSAEEYTGMLSALSSMLEGVSATRQKLRSVSTEANQSSTAAVQDLASQAPAAGSYLDRPAVTRLAIGSRDQLLQSMLPIANSQSIVLSALRG